MIFEKKLNPWAKRGHCLVYGRRKGVGSGTTNGFDWEMFHFFQESFSFKHMRRVIFIVSFL